MFGTQRLLDDVLTRRARRSLPSLGNRRARRRPRRIAALELLEGRTLLTTFTVSSTGTGNVAGTLLYEINQLNATGGSSNLINFNIPGSGVQTISPSSPLPAITKPVTIEGTVSGGVPQIQILGGSAGNANGLTFGSGSSGSSVQDLVIAGFASGDGVEITSVSTGDSVLGCWLGINASGTADANGYGILALASGATIGGTTTGAGNIISGNAGDGVYLGASCLVEGNDIGTNAAGTAAVANGVYGIGVYAAGATIGGTTTGAGNIISGNTYDGVYVAASCLIEGNDIGTNGAGTAAVANLDYGILVVAAGATIGGTATGAGNIISGNTTDGVYVAASCLIEGNDIGTNAAGTAAVPNGTYGIGVYAAGVTIGGTTTGAGNVISGNTDDGVYIGTSCLVEGNDIGSNAVGTSIANEYGIYVAAAGATIGGTTTDAANIISGNTDDGVWIDAPCLVQGNDIGIGTDDGWIAIVSNGYGVVVSAPGATIGGTATGAGNIISGNTDDGVYINASCLVEGNDIGATAANEYGVVVLAPGATIGGTTTGAGNIISGNYLAGVYIDSSCLIEGNDIGTNAGASAAVANGFGIYVAASGATIGGTATGAGNIISGNSDEGVYIEASCLIEGNDIGTNAGASAAVANGFGISVGASGATIGGTATGAGNVISGNLEDGIDIDASCLVEGNDIGTNAAGTASVPNAYGVYLYDSEATIGGTATGAGNTISDNSQAGIYLANGAASTITDDAITDDSTGILVGNGPSDTCVVTAQDDNLSGNTTAGISNNQTNASYAVTATDDWWGTLHGPTTAANPGGDGTGVSSNVSFTPWIGVFTAGTGAGFHPTGITLYAVPTRLVFVTEPSSTANLGVAFATQPVVEAEDASGTLGINFDATTVPGAQAVLTLNGLSAAGTLGGTTAVSPSGGFANFSGLDITGGGTYTLTASDSEFGSLSVSGTSTQIQIAGDFTDTVTSTGTGNVPGTLLYAINQLNSLGGSSNIINFNLGSGVQTISPTSALPAITKPVTIEGTSVGGVPQVQILGGSAGNANGLTFGSGSSGSSVQDLVIAGFASGDGVEITSVSTGDSVLGCWLGINASGTADANGYGILALASGATIGGTTTGAGNLISGNAGDGVYLGASCLVEGNDIGTNAAGTAAVANGVYGIGVYAAGATIGGTTTGAGNIISGNTYDGVYVAASCLIEGNGIGTNAAGTAAVANLDYGILVVAAGATIGGTATGAGNIISGNTTDGVYVAASCLIEGNDIGTNAAGTAAVPNGTYGIGVYAAGVTIGGTATGAGNVISGNTSDGVYVAVSCLVEGNDIGASAAGTAAVPNGTYGIGVYAAGTTIGGTTTGAGNIVSGNTDDGVYIGASCLVEGNDIGTNLTGTAAVANVDYGISVVAAGATIGGTATGAGNTISDNGQAGVDVSYGATATITDDTITGNSIGILVGSGAGDTCLVTAQDDNLSGNTTAGVTNNQTNAPYAVTATDDWWGSLHGPTTTASPGGNGTKISSNVSFTPWIGVFTAGSGPGFQPTGITLYAVPTRLVFVTEPSSTANSGVAFATQPVVEAEDASGNLGINFDAATVPGAQAVMTLHTLSGTGVLAGTASVSPSAGFASFSGLNITAIGTYALTVSALGFGSLSPSGTSSQISVAALVGTVTTTVLTTGANPSTYGTALTFTATVTSSSGLPTGSVEFYDGTTPIGAGSSLSGSGDSATSTFTISTLSAGAHSINAVYGPTGAFAGSNSPYLGQTVNPASLTITATNQTETYGFGGTSASMGTTAFTSSGLRNDETIGGVTLSTNDSTSSSGEYTAGTYSITPSSATGGTFNASNYNINYVNGTLTVDRKALTITANNQTQTYGTGNDLAQGVSFAGLVIGDVVTASLSTNATTSTSGNWNAGAWAIMALSAAGADAGDYGPITYDSGTLTVSPASLTVTASSDSMTYGSTVPALAYTYTGLVNNDTSASFTGGLATTATSASNVGTYPITEGALAATGNYTIGTFNAGTLTVSPASLTVTASNESMTYGSTVPALAYTYTGLVNNDTSASFTGGLATTATSASNVGTYPITEGALAATGNYTIGTFNAGTLTVSPASLTVTATEPPAGVLAGNAFGLTVDEVNAQNQLDTSYDGTVTLSLASNPGGSTLGGTLTVQASGGVATFTGLTINNPGLAYTLQVSAMDTAPVTTSNVDVAGYQLAPDATNANLDDLYWYGTSGSDQVQFIQTAAGTVQIKVNELAGIATSFTATIAGVTGSVVADEYDIAGDTDVIDGSGLTTIPSVITVGNGNDTIIGGGGANTIAAGDGDNTIYGNGVGNSPNAKGVQDPSNTITVGSGNNIIYGNFSGSGFQGGNNTITAGNGNNTIYGNYGNGGYTGDGAEGSDNTITVGDGDNTIYGNYGNADGGEGGSNTIVAGNGNNIIFGNADGSDAKHKQGNNFIQVGNGTNTIYGNLGGDGGEGGNNTILTGSGQDTIYGNFGGDGGEGGNNLIVAGGGNDTIYAHCALPVTSTTSGTTAEGRDLIIGGTGADTVFGWPAGYTLGSNTGDLFIAGTTNLSLTALDAVLAEWSSSDSYATRVADLSGANGTVGANGSNYLISDTTVFGSAAVDEIFGTVGSDDDWYLVTSNDQLNNVSPNEVTQID